MTLPAPAFCDARSVVIEWIEFNSAGFCIPDSDWGRSLYGAIRVLLEASTGEMGSE